MISFNIDADTLIDSSGHFMSASGLQKSAQYCCVFDQWIQCCCRHLPLPRADAESKLQQEAAIEQLLEELDIDLLVLARYHITKPCTCVWSLALFSQACFAVEHHLLGVITTFETKLACMM